MLRIVHDGTPAFDAELDRLERRGESDFERVEPAVREILAAVRAEGDTAVLRYAERFDHRRPDTLVRVTGSAAGAAMAPDDGAAALERLPEHAASAMRLAAERIRAFHARQLEFFFSRSSGSPWAGFRYEADGVSLGLRCRPLERVGIYAPGGKARYPSSVLMSAIPAQIAGVKEIVLATPLQGDASDDAIFAAAHLSGVTRIVDAGGAQAIAALAYGTESIPRVDKIVGPGNIFVTVAKREVFGSVGIDALYGPSETIVIADDTADPMFAAADLLAQAEHDELATPILLTTSEKMAEAIGREVERQLQLLERRDIARTSFDARGGAVIVSSVEEAVALGSEYAPEHMCLLVRDAAAVAKTVRNAGGIFVGDDAPESLGDYTAGPSHVMPTAGAARYASPLGVHDFLKVTSVIAVDAARLREAGPAAARIARAEGFTAHARSIELRLQGGEADGGPK